MTVRAPVAPDVIAWAMDRSGVEVQDLAGSIPKLEPWLRGETDTGPTFLQIKQLSRKTGIPLGYLFLKSPPALALPIPDFREGHAGLPDEPSADLLAVVHQSIRRQDWYREYAEANGLAEVKEVGRGRSMSPTEAAEDMRKRLRFEVTGRKTRGDANRKHLLLAFEALGGLTVATSMVGNNTHRLLDPDEFRGFALSDELAPLIFINTRQTMNAQLFTIAHEVAHVWRKSTGVSLEDPSEDDQPEVERWCNRVASEFLVPAEELKRHYARLGKLELTELLERLATVFRCGTLVILQALRRHRVRKFADFDAAYREERQRLLVLAEATARSAQGDYWLNQPFRIGTRFAQAIVRDTMRGNTGAADAVRLTGLGSLGSLQEYARRIGVA